jgi:three-Cys-motif partner protein
LGKELNMNQFGGSWTEEKMDIVIKYASAYLTIMNKQGWVKTIYFDGFAGSGFIESAGEPINIKGTALRILELSEPRPFDIYHFVELVEEHVEDLETNLKKHPFRENIFIVRRDCNEKMVDLAKYLKNNPNFRALVYIDPYGMSVNWSSVASLKNLGIDLWILVPTGIGVNRMLTRDGIIFEPWMQKLENFLGYTREEIMEHFYKFSTQQTLFGEDTIIQKEKNAVLLASELYTRKLNEVFSHVSKSFVLRNIQNAIMYHFIMASNNRNAVKIANDVIDSKYKL